jgi:hypothetical protein
LIHFLKFLSEIHLFCLPLIDHLIKAMSHL